jgi:thioredoxin 1
MVQLTTNELKEKINNGENFVLDLYAVWCGPCKESLISESTDRPKYGVYKFDIDSDMDFVRELGVRSVPTIKIFKEGSEVYSRAGVMSSTEVLGLLN